MKRTATNDLAVFMPIVTNRKGRLVNRRAMTFFLFTLPALLLYGFFFVYPVIMGFYYSMTDWDGMSPTFNFIGLVNYVSIFSDPRFTSDITFTATYTILLVICITGLSLGIALILNSKLVRLRTFFRAVYFFPAVLSMVTVGLIWNEIYYGAIPVIGKWLGIKALSVNILGDPHLAMYGILFVHVWQGTAVPMVIFLAGLQSVPQDLYEAATIDGANHVQKFKNVTFPFLVPVLSVVLVITVTAGLTVFDYIMAMTGGGPGFATESIGLLIYNNGFTNMKFGYGSAESVFLLIVIAGVSVIQLLILNRKGVGQQ